MIIVFSVGKMGICFFWTYCCFSRGCPWLSTKTSGSKLLQGTSKWNLAGRRQEGSWGSAPGT